MQLRSGGNAALMTDQSVMVRACCSDLETVSVALMCKCAICCSDTEQQIFSVVNDIYLR